MLKYLYQFLQFKKKKDNHNLLPIVSLKKKKKTIEKCNLREKKNIGREKCYLSSSAVLITAGGRKYHGKTGIGEHSEE